MHYSNIINVVKNKKVLLLGFGREGRSTYQFLRKLLPNQYFTISDKNPNLIKDNSDIVADKYLEIIQGEDYLKKISEFDLIIKSPGISLKDYKKIIDASKITSQIDLFLKEFHLQTIGITGTKGKSTTSSLIYHVLKAKNDNTVLVGNIGLPPFEIIDQINENTRIVCEMSSHQLEYISQSPHIAVLLNIFEEHLDHYNSYLEYQLAKWQIALKQNTKDYIIYSAENENIKLLLERYPVLGKQFSFSLNRPVKNGVYKKVNELLMVINGKEKSIYDIKSKRNLLGEHNLLNIAAAFIACQLINIDPQFFFEKLSDFKGLPHRLEFVGEYDGITYYNDSIATIPEATIQAIEALENVDTLILGGHDRGIDYKELIKYLAKDKNITNVYLLGKAGERMYEDLSLYNNKNYQLVSNLDEAVCNAKQSTRKGKICLLSPAASSYDQYKNFEYRGEHFKKLIRQ